MWLYSYYIAMFWGSFADPKLAVLFFAMLAV
jgi:hypothetical protein